MSGPNDTLGYNAAQAQANAAPVTGQWDVNQVTGAMFNSGTGEIQGPGFFQQGGMAQMGLGAISTLGGLWNSFQQSKIAKKSLQLQTKAFETNLKNQTQTYNTELEDRIRNRYAGGGATGADLDNKTASYVEKNKL